MGWWFRNASAIEALAACITALVALLALVGIRYQLNEADRLQQLQSARDSYRGHLALAVSAPEFARPQDGCALLESSKAGAYEAFVDHLLYSAEQMLAANEGWSDTFLDALEPHAQYICAHPTLWSATPEMSALLDTFSRGHCAAVVSCGTQ